MKPLKFLTTSQVHNSWVTKSLREAGPVTYMDRPDGEGNDRTPLYSKGVLEGALADGFRVVVVSSRGRTGDHDTWWMDLLHPEDIHFQGPHGMDQQSFTEFCVDILGGDYGIDWPLDGRGNPAFFLQALGEINNLQVDAA